jgi:putative PIN family toxin of toxin-antitoxin system
VLRVVADPGVLVSGVLTRVGPPAEILDRWRAGEFDLVVSPKLLGELEDVLLRPTFRSAISELDARDYVDGLAAEAVLVPDPDEVPAVTRDPDDDYLVALAVAADADAIVSGDTHLTELENPRMPVVKPRGFVERLKRS